MFDGDFRSRRREVNLSGRKTGGRRDLLKNAEILRKKRQENQRRLKASVLIQSTARSYLSRLRVIERCSRIVLFPNDVPSILSTKTKASFSMKQISALSICLLYQSKLTKFDTTRTGLLLAFQHYDSQFPMRNDDAGSNSSWFSQKRMAFHVLLEFDPASNNERETMQKFYRLLEKYNALIRIDDCFFLQLSKCMQNWLNFINDGDRMDSDDNELYFAKECATFLIQWTENAKQRLKNPNASALLASILLGGITYSINNSERNPLLNLRFNELGWLGSLTEIFQTSGIVVSFSTEALTKINNNDSLRQATKENLCNKNAQRLLYNVLNVSSSPQLIPLIYHVLSQPQNGKLKLAVSLVARGDLFSSMHVNQNFNKKNDYGSNTKWRIEDEVSDIEEDEEEFNSNASSSNKKARSGSTQYKRQEILTLIKLDRLYNKRIQQKIREQQIFDPDTIKIAKKVIEAPWKDWGLHCFSQRDDNLQKQRYIEALCLLLECSSSLRPKTKFTPMSTLAFNQAILRAIWSHILEEEKEQFDRLLVFAELFSHYLVALSDEDFVKHHCVPSSERNGKKIIAKDVVVRFREALYVLYWSKPVTEREIQLDNIRGRMMLSGTRLWNSLYDRWHRLLKNSFCEESTWWFPNVSSNDGDRSVNIFGEGDDDVDSMDPDENHHQLSSAEEATDALADSFSDPKMARVLTSCPQALPFQCRVKLFHSLLKADKQKTFQTFANRRALMAIRGQLGGDEPMLWPDGNIREQVKIRRSDLYADSMQELNKLGFDIKHQIQVTFINQHGVEEPGIDGGGVFKEFLDDLIKDGFANDEELKLGRPQLFSLTPKQELTINPDLSQNDDMLVHYEFLGRILGKAVYESISVEPQLCLPFLRLMMGKFNTLEDMKNYDYEYYINLNKLRRFSEEEINDLGLVFELTVPGKPPRTIELVPSGRHISVNKGNVFQYAQSIGNQILNVLGAKQTKAFLNGFRDLIPISWIKLFSPKELQKLISGDDSVKGIDVKSLKQATQYLGGYHESQPYVNDFWDILENELSFEQQRKFLRFMTSCSRQPLLGFCSLQPPPAIQQIHLKDNERTKNSRLPTSSTCMNLLKLPNYGNKSLLKVKLIDAIESGSGFELT